MRTYEQFRKIHEFFVQGKTDLALHLLMQVQADQISLQDRIDSLKARIQEFEDIVLLSKELFFDNNFYWLRTDSVVQGPFCPQCYEGDGALFRLHRHEGALYCDNCTSLYGCNAQAVGACEESTKVHTANLIPFATRLF